MHVMMTVNAAWNIGNFRKPVLRSLLDDGHKVTVLAPPDESVSDLQKEGCYFIPLTMSVKGLNPVSDLRLLQTFRRTFVSEKPDIVLSYTIKNNLYGALAAEPLGIPFLPNVTGLGTAFLSGGGLQTLADLLYKRAFRNLPTVFFQNRDDRELFIRRKLVRGNQCRVLPGSGIDLVRFGPKKPPLNTNPVFLMIARLLRDKGVFEYVEAARQVRRVQPLARFQLLGASDVQNRSAIDSETVALWQREGVIEYLGTMSDVRPAIETADCVVLPSYREGAPRTLIEAAAMARPVIATDVPGCRSVVDDGTTGFLCAVRNAESLAAVCRQFVELTAGARAAMGLAGRAKMELEFDQALVVAAYRKAISELPMMRNTNGLDLG